MIYGGLPAVALMQTSEQKMSYLQTQLKNLYIKDIVSRYKLTGEENISELLDIIASGTSTLVNPRKLANTFRSVKGSSISESVIAKYIAYFEDSFVVSRAKRYDIKGKKYIDTPYKVYFEDQGLRNARLNFRQTEPTHLMENIIYNELRTRGYSVDVGVVEVRCKTPDGKEERRQYEIDFVANLGSKRYYIQSAYDIPTKEKMDQETFSYKKLEDSFKKMIIVEKSKKPMYDENGYVTIGIKEFLLDPKSLEW